LLTWVKVSVIIVSGLGLVLKGLELGWGWKIAPVMYICPSQTENNTKLYMRWCWMYNCWRFLWETTISATNHIGHSHIGHKRHLPQTISATACTISATHNVDIGHKLTKINKTEWKWNAGHSMASLLHVSRANPVHMCSINCRCYGRSIMPENAPWTAGLLRACFLPVLFVTVTICLTIDRLCRLALYSLP